MDASGESTLPCRRDANFMVLGPNMETHDAESALAPDGVAVGLDRHKFGARPHLHRFGGDNHWLLQKSSTTSALAKAHFMSLGLKAQVTWVRRPGFQRCGSEQQRYGAGAGHMRKLHSALFVLPPLDNRGQHYLHQGSECGPLDALRAPLVKGPGELSLVPILVSALSTSSDIGSVAALSTASLVSTAASSLTHLTVLPVRNRSRSSYWWRSAPTCVHV